MLISIYDIIKRYKLSKRKVIYTDIEDEIVAALSKSICEEIDNEIIKELRKLASANKSI